MEPMIVATQLPTTGFLGTGATFAADINLIVQLAMGGALIVGTILAKRKRYRAHGTCQSTVLLLNLWMIGFEMWTSFRLQLAPHLARVFRSSYYTVATIHAALGTAAELLGIYILTCGRNRIAFSVTALHTVEAMDASRTGALVVRSDLGNWGLLRMVRCALPMNTGSPAANRQSEKLRKTNAQLNVLLPTSSIRWHLQKVCH
jgi:uncharacterized membrane protein YozB (DUF420 family)